MVDKNRVIAQVMQLPAEDQPAVIAAAIAEWMVDARGMTQLFEQVSEAISAAGDDELQGEFIASLEDWE
jgi:hypothetical protein